VLHLVAIAKAQPARRAVDIPDANERALLDGVPDNPLRLTVRSTETAARSSRLPPDLS
jgi:hypothetical protein